LNVEAASCRLPNVLGNLNFIEERELTGAAGDLDSTAYRGAGIREGFSGGERQKRQDAAST
jgi:hypothetical protein